MPRCTREYEDKQSVSFVIPSIKLLNLVIGVDNRRNHEPHALRVLLLRPPGFLLSALERFKRSLMTSVSYLSG